MGRGCGQGEWTEGVDTGQEGQADGPGKHELGRRARGVKRDIGEGELGMRVGKGSKGQGNGDWRLERRINVSHNIQTSCPMT